MDRVKRENDCTGGFGMNGPPLVVERNARGLVSFEENACHQGTCEDREVWLGHERIDVCAEKRLSLAVANGFVEERASPRRRLHHLTIRIRVSCEPQSFSGFQ